MFPFALAFLQAIEDIFLFIFNHFSFSWKEEQGIWKKAYTTKTTDHNYYVSGVECQIDRFACFAAYFSFFPKENVFQNLEENLWTLNRKTEFPDFSLTLTISKIFPNFLKDSLTFPELENFCFPWLFPDRGNPEFYSGGKDERLRPFVKLTYSFFKLIR